MYPSTIVQASYLNRVRESRANALTLHSVPIADNQPPLMFATLLKELGGIVKYHQVLDSCPSLVNELTGKVATTLEGITEELKLACHKMMWDALDMEDAAFRNLLAPTTPPFTIHMCPDMPQRSSPPNFDLVGQHWLCTLLCASLRPFFKIVPILGCETVSLTVEGSDNKPTICGTAVVETLVKIRGTMLRHLAVSV
jgi:hypothetical protein